MRYFEHWLVCVWFHAHMQNGAYSAAKLGIGGLGAVCSTRLGAFFFQTGGFKIYLIRIAK